MTINTHKENKEINFLWCQEENIAMACDTYDFREWTYQCMPHNKKKFIIVQLGRESIGGCVFVIKQK